MNLEDILKEYKNEIGIVMHIDCLCEELKEHYSTEEVIKILKEIQEKNIKLYNQYTEEIEKIDDQIDTCIIPKLKTIDLTKDTKETIKQEEISYNDEFLKCIELITNDKTTDIMPIISEIKDDQSLNTIKCRILEEITLYKKELLKEDDSETIIYYEKQIEILEEKLNTVVNYHANLNISVTPIKKHHLIFINNGDKNIFYDELKQIDSDDYEAILNLLNLIINNQTHLFKTFTNNDKFRGLLEVRDLYNKYRVVFKVVNNYYVIISTFYKDCDNNTIYRSRLRNKVDIFNDNIDVIENQLKTDPSIYLETEKEILNYLASAPKKKGLK